MCGFGHAGIRDLLAGLIEVLAKVFRIAKFSDLRRSVGRVSLIDELTVLGKKWAPPAEDFHLQVCARAGRTYSKAPFDESKRAFLSSATWTRTTDLVINSHPLYRLSYGGIKKRALRRATNKKIPKVRAGCQGSG